MKFLTFVVLVVAVAGSSVYPVVAAEPGVPDDFKSIQSAFVILAPTKSPVITGNVAESSDRKAQIGTLDGKPFDAGGNRLAAPAPDTLQR
tara:strand:+ start:192173 stop:192442 length:270 start_codon:yes stop_codon:yes gene_type:complete